MDLQYNQIDNYTTLSDLHFDIQHFANKHRDMDLDIFVVRKLDSMGNRMIIHTLADSLRMDYRDILVNIGTHQRRFVHGTQHSRHMDLEYTVSNFLLDNQLEFRDLEFNIQFL